MTARTWVRTQTTFCPKFLLLQTQTSFNLDLCPKLLSWLHLLPSNLPCVTLTWPGARKPLLNLSTLIYELPRLSGTTGKLSVLHLPEHDGGP